MSGVRAIAVFVALVGLLASIALRPARVMLFGLAPGDATLAIRCGLMASASLATMVAVFGVRAIALRRWLCVISPAFMFLPEYPAALAPFGLLPFFLSLIRARTHREAALFGAVAGVSQVLGSAGWIFQYFSEPILPGVIAFVVALVLWAPMAFATRALIQRSSWWIPAAAAFVPLTEAIRGEWMNPPLPGLLMAHANADTALIWLARGCGEPGIAFVVALLGLGGAHWLSKGPSRGLLRWAPVAVICGTLAALSPTRSAEQPTTQPRKMVCAIKDPSRSGSRPAFGGGAEISILALARHAEELGCAVIAFPEYSLRLEPRQVLSPGWGLARMGDRPLVLAGAWVDYRQRTAPRRWVRNVVCRLELGPGRQINCAGGFDKLVFAPFGEVGLFQDVPLLAPLGAWVSRQATGAKNLPLRSIQPVGLLPIGGGKQAGVAICWEILVPRIFERRGVARRGDAQLLVVVSDLDGFGGSQAAINQFRRAASLHAVSLGAPLLFASTNDPFLVTSRGALLSPVLDEPFVTAWRAAF